MNRPLVAIEVIERLEVDRDVARDKRGHENERAAMPFTKRPGPKWNGVMGTARMMNIARSGTATHVRCSPQRRRASHIRSGRNPSDTGVHGRRAVLCNRADLYASYRRANAASIARTRSSAASTAPKSAAVM